MQFRKLLTPLIALLAISAVAIAYPRQSAGAQDKTKPAADKPAADKPAAADPVTGSYEGIAKSEALGDIPIKVAIKNVNGKLSGSIDTPQGAAPITDGTYTADGKMSLKFDAGGNEGTVAAQLKDDKIVGNWALAGATGTLELKRAAAVAAVTPTPAPKKEEAKPSAMDPISGEWDGTAEVQGMTVPFTLKMKVEGDKVTGESSSAQGTAPISKGTWSGDKLTLALDTPGGAITFTGALKDGKLVGDFDFASQMQGKWEATKKKN